MYVYNKNYTYSFNDQNNVPVNSLSYDVSDNDVNVICLFCMLLIVTDFSNVM